MSEGYVLIEGDVDVGKESNVLIEEDVDARKEGNVFTYAEKLLR
jgi:hypothetical protein